MTHLHLSSGLRSSYILSPTMGQGLSSFRGVCRVAMHSASVRYLHCCLEGFGRFHRPIVATRSTADRSIRFQERRISHFRRRRSGMEATLSCLLVPLRHEPILRQYPPAEALAGQRNGQRAAHHDRQTRNSASFHPHSQVVRLLDARAMLTVSSGTSSYAAPESSSAAANPILVLDHRVSWSCK